MATKTMRTVRRIEKPRPLKTSENFVKLLPVTNDSNLQQEKSLPGDNVLENLRCLHISISNGNLNESTFVLIGHVCTQLKDSGSYLELAAKDQLDKYFVTLRNASRDERIPIHTRACLLQIIELRAMGWKTNDNISSYYEQRTVNSEQQSPTYLMSSVSVPNALMSSMSTSAIPTSLFQPPQNIMTSASQVSLGPGEIIKNSGKFIKPTKIPGKNFYKDEILIRNSDSGKVMGIKGRRVHMIEELSDTIISFQRVSPGARDRLVQITGPHEDNIGRAKVLIEDTIRRNASPVRDTPGLGSLGGLVTSGSCTSLNSSASEESLHNQPVAVQYQPPKHYVQQIPNAQLNMQACQPSPAVVQQQQQQPLAKKIPLMHSFSMGNTLGEYSYTIAIGPNAIRISGSDADVVKTAKLVLEEYFAGQAELSHNESSSDVNNAFTTQRRHSKVQKQSTLDSENGSGSLSNGHVGNSSSEEETFKVEGSPPVQGFDLPLDSPGMQANTLVRTQPLNASEMPFTVKPDPATQVESSVNVNKGKVTVVRQPLFPASKPDDYKKAENSGDMAKRRRDMFGRSSSQRDSSSQESSFDRQVSEEGRRTESCRVFNTYSFLLDCAASQACRVLPEELKHVLPDVASIIVQESPAEYFDPVAYKALASVRRSSSSTVRKSSTGGNEELWVIE